MSSEGDQSHTDSNVINTRLIVSTNKFDEADGTDKKLSPSKWKPIPIYTLGTGTEETGSRS